MLPENVRQLFLAWKEIPAHTCRCVTHVNAKGEPLALIMVCEREKRWRRYCDARNRVMEKLMGRGYKIKLNDIFNEDEFV